MTMTTMMTMTMMNTTMIKPSRTVSPPSWQWQQHNFRAMSTGIHALIYTPAKRSLVGTIENLFRYFEQLLSRFQPTSELSRLNNHDGSIFMATPDLFAAVEAALWAAQQSGGIYDPTILPYLERAGYDCTFAAIDDQRPLRTVTEPAGDGYQAMRVPDLRSGLDYRHVQVDRSTGMIKRPIGMLLDLGGMGKGWTVDRVVDEVCGDGPCLINAGGDLYAYGFPDGSRGWEIKLAHPLKPEMTLATLTLAHHAVATSTIAKRRWLKDGLLQHHLINPRTGYPAMTDAISVSVVGGRVFTAEVHAKVALILGVEEGLAYLESQPDVEGLIFSTGGEALLTSGMGQFGERLDIIGNGPKNEWSNDYDQA